MRHFWAIFLVRSAQLGDPFDPAEIHFGAKQVDSTKNDSGPLSSFRANALYVHRFCRFETGSCDGLADFVIVWRKQDEQWKAKSSAQLAVEVTIEIEGQPKPACVALSLSRRFT